MKHYSYPQRAFCLVEEKITDDSKCMIGVIIITEVGISSYASLNERVICSTNQITKIHKDSHRH